MKIAAIVTGHLRMLRYCYRSIINCLPEQTEFYVHGHDDEFIESAHLLSPRLVSRFTDHSVPERRIYHQLFQPSYHSVQSQLRTLHTEQAAWRNYVATGHSHDVICRLRADLILIGRPEIDMCMSNQVFVLPHGSWGGLNINFAYGTPAIMQRLFNKMSLLDEYTDIGGRFHAETFTRWILRDADVRYMDVWAPILRPNLIVDGPYYSRAWGDPEVGDLERVKQVVEVFNEETAYSVLPVTDEIYEEYSYRC